MIFLSKTFTWKINFSIEKIKIFDVFKIKISQITFLQEKIFFDQDFFKDLEFIYTFDLEGF